MASIATVLRSRRRGRQSPAVATWRWWKQIQRWLRWGQATINKTAAATDAHAFERHRHTDVRAFVFRRGRRDGGADGVVVSNSSARGDVRRGRRSADEAEGNADNTIC
jgi:hypothetical protein